MARFGILPRIIDTLRYWEQLLNGGLTFNRNMRGTVWSGSIEPGAEQAIPHTLKQTPSGFIVTDAANTNNLVRGSTPWNSGFVFIKNQSGSQTFTGRIFILP